MKKHIKSIYKISIVFLLIVPLYSVAMWSRAGQRLLPSARTAGKKFFKQTTRKYHDYLRPAFGKKQPKIPQLRKPFTGMGKAESPSTPGYNYGIQYSRNIPKRIPILQYPTFTPKRTYTPIFNQKMWGTGKNLWQKTTLPIKHFWQETMLPSMRRTIKQIPRPRNPFVKKPPYKDYIKEAEKMLKKPKLKVYKLPEPTFRESARQSITNASKHARNWWQKTAVPRAQQFGTFIKYFPRTKAEAKAADKIARAQYRKLIRGTIKITPKQETKLIPYLEKMIAKRIPLATQQKIMGGLIAAFFGAAIIKGHKQIGQDFIETVDKYLGDDQPAEFDPNNEYQELYEDQPPYEDQPRPIYQEGESPQFPQIGDQYQPERIYTEENFEQ